MKDLFVGASGRLNNHGGSRMFTTPHTINVPPEYTVETDVPSVAEFVTCSLDGRLWVYRRSRRFYVAAFRWNEDTQRLVFVGTTILSNEAFVMRGADWILTNKSLIQSLDDEPYISRTTYNDSSFLDAIKKSYSFFPEIETWQKIQGEQIIRVDNPPSENLQELTQSLVTPLEFHYYSENNIKAFSEFSPKLCYINGQLYGKGKAHIGRAYLLPRTFNEDGETEDFYLYISPDYLRTYNGSFDDNDGWENLRVAPFTPESVAIFTPKNDDYSICKKATNAQIFTLPNGESLDLSADNGALFFDALTGSNLALNDGGASLLRDGLNYECKGLRQWIAPSGKVDMVSPQLVMSSFDNGTLATHVQGGFHRELLAGKTLPLSVRDYSDKRLSLESVDSNSRKTIQVNNTDGMNDIQFIEEITYKPAVEVQLLNNVHYNYDTTVFPFFIRADSDSLNFDGKYYTSDPYWRCVPIFEDASARQFGVRINRYKTQTINWYGEKFEVTGDIYWEDREYSGDDNSYFDYDYAHITHYTTKLIYIDPQTGKLLSFKISVTPENRIAYKTVYTSMKIITSGGGVFGVPYSYQDIDENEVELCRHFICTIHNGRIFLLGYYNNISFPKYPERLFFVANVPDEIISYVPDFEINSVTQRKFFLRDFTTDNQKEGNLLTCFNAFSYFDVFNTCKSDIPQGYKPDMMYTFSDWSSLVEINGHKICTKAIHVIIEPAGDVTKPSQLIVFRSEIHPEIFDFKTEIERSKLF